MTRSWAPWSLDAGCTPWRRWNILTPLTLPQSDLVWRFNLTDRDAFTCVQLEFPSKRDRWLAVGVQATAQLIVG